MNACKSPQQYLKCADNTTNIVTWNFTNNKVLKKCMVNESCKAEMKSKRTGPYTIVGITAVGASKLRDKHGHILKSHNPPNQVKWYYEGVPAEEDDEDLLLSAYTSAEVTGADDDVDK